MFEIFEDFNSFHVSMLTYIILGSIIVVLNMPLLYLLIFIKQNRERKEFVLIAIICSVDLLYVVVNSYNSISRLILGTSTNVVAKIECVLRPNLFISLVVIQLVSQMPLFVAIDRLFAVVYSIWYYKRGVCYSFFLCSLPMIGSVVTTIANVISIYNGPEKESQVMAVCFSSSLVASSFKPYFHGTKWACLILATIVNVFVGIILHCNTKIKHQNTTKRLKNANMVIFSNTVNSLVFLMIPDMILAYPPKMDNFIYLQITMFSLIMSKIIFNIVLFLFFHKELRTLYLNLFKRKLFYNGGRMSGVRIVPVPQQELKTSAHNA
ncbi:unnamed protein product [Caenorhabditis bovis]|uniref:G-protein coupled receptors family 1 profile domain-containing protein n=1 Tax=Caenorhabditis bovis TaxID=2654633 RepID=A0A8S1EXG1_9PELO|nr:unnamed protein product [Caenorhabditis bovis]